jgi:uncharacterized protein DUF1549/uncharacterized protein DUF1553
MEKRRGSVVGRWAALGLCLGLAGAAGAAPAAKPAPKPAATKPAAPAPSTAGLVKVSVQPDQVVLAGRDTAQRFMVFGHYSDGRVRDLTSSAKLSKTGQGGFRIEGNEVMATLNGEAQLVASAGGQQGVMKVTVQNVGDPQQWSFANDISPILTKAGCNTGGCHGSPSGRGGFRLSLFGYEPDYDFDMITKDKNGARINKNQPTASLILQKPTAKVPHKGGLRFKEGSEFYTRILEWLKAGAPKGPEFDARLKSVQIYPAEWTLDKPEQTQQIVVMAVRDDGTTQDVTQYARYNTNDDQVGDVDDDGIITATGKGETSIMIRYLGGVGIVRLKVPRDPVPADAFDNFKPANYIDELVLEKLKEVRMPPSDPASDEEFLRRAYIDTCGITPTVEEAKAFLDDKDPNKRAKLVEQLLSRPEFIDYWTLKWSDLLRNNKGVKRDKGLQVFYRWIRDSVRDNKPWDQFSRELITAAGSNYRSGTANWYRLPNDEINGPEYPLFMGSATSQVFLGVRFDCARCHNHPFEAWSQMDYYGLSAFFAKTKAKNGPDEEEKIIYAASVGDVKHPRTNVTIEAKYPAGDVATFSPDEDAREKLAQWMTSPGNYWFKRSIANRLWNNFFGRGIIQPVDDFRLTNPASNQKLLDAMGEKVVAYKFDLKKLMRDILNSRTYQTTSRPNKYKSNVDDKLYASRSLPRRLYAEVLLDAIAYATGVPENLGPYARAVAAADNEVGRGGFLDLFGRARREVACECERSDETNVTMVLNLLNGGTVNGKITNPGGRVARLVNAKKPEKELIEEFYLAALSRRPSETEQAAAVKLIKGAPSLKEGAEDLMWGLLNMREFLLNH